MSEPKRKTNADMCVKTTAGFLINYDSSINLYPQISSTNFKFNAFGHPLTKPQFEWPIFGDSTCTLGVPIAQSYVRSTGVSEIFMLIAISQQYFILKCILNTLS